MEKVIIYTKSYCPYSIKAKELLKMKNIDFKEIDVTDNPEAFEEMIKLANGRKTVPQVFINGEHIGGYDNLSELNESGKLDAYFTEDLKITEYMGKHCAEESSFKVMPEVLIDADLSDDAEINLMQEYLHN